MVSMLSVSSSIRSWRGKCFFLPPSCSGLWAWVMFAYPVRFSGAAMKLNGHEAPQSEGVGVLIH